MKNTDFGRLKSDKLVDSSTSLLAYKEAKDIYEMETIMGGPIEFSKILDNVVESFDDFTEAELNEYTTNQNLLRNKRAKEWSKIICNSGRKAL